MLCTTELDMANTVETSDIDTFLTNATWAICSTFHIVLKASLDAAIIGWDMLVDIPFLAAWDKIGEHRQHPQNRTETCSCCDWYYNVGYRVLLRKDDILYTSESWYEGDPWTITTVCTNGTIGFNMEQNQNDSTSEELLPFSIAKLKQLLMLFFYVTSPSS